jgi:carboxylesterase type B
MLAHHPSMLLKDGSEEVLTVFRHRYPHATFTELLVTIATAKVHEHAVMMAERMSLAGRAPVFKYLFDYKAPMPDDSPFAGRLMAAHCFDLPFFFDIAERSQIAGKRDDRVGLAARISRCWISFARTGRVDQESLGEWAEYDTGQRRQMVLSASPHLEGDSAQNGFYRDEAEVVKALRAANDSPLS